MKKAARGKHSEEYFGDSRDYWWNDDFLALALRRWFPLRIRSVLDVGCGVGHWSRAWARVLPASVQFTGVDREVAWVKRAERECQRAGLGARTRFQQGVAERLPFADNSFDFVTCQTVLIHVPDVAKVVAEMVRVTRPGGIIVAAEPNNAAIPVLEDALAAGFSSSETARLIEFHLVCLAGKASLGLGDETVGRDLVRLFNQAELEQIAACLNEKVWAMTPPYKTLRERALVKELANRAKRNLWMWDRRETTRFFLAGGGLRKEFSRSWNLAMKLQRAVSESMRVGRFSCSGGALFYLVAGRKKS